MKYWDIITPDHQRKRHDLKMQELNQRLSNAAESLQCELIRLDYETRLAAQATRIMHDVNELIASHGLYIDGSSIADRLILYSDHAPHDLI